MSPAGLRPTPPCAPARPPVLQSIAPAFESSSTKPCPDSLRPRYHLYAPAPSTTHSPRHSSSYARAPDYSPHTPSQTQATASPRDTNNSDSATNGLSYEI